MTSDSLPLERHPFPPFIPADARVLIMGTFPPKPIRWSMEFYYPNKTNDFWRVMGIIFYNDVNHFRLPDGTFDEPLIRRFLEEKGIALHDTGAAVRRLKDNASDKFLDIVEPVNLGALLERMPGCHVIATTGEKAAGVLASLTSSPLPKIGEWVETVWPADGRKLFITRMPSTSRAYPLAVDKKAAAYRGLFHKANLI
ncbi:MAG: uracil-DNA glycosylase family protein [Staphylococcus sp.]|nr:uracil-DNA glycosylase family protein [Staphylococcus sp.]